MHTAPGMMSADAAGGGQRHAAQMTTSGAALNVRMEKIIPRTTCASRNPIEHDAARLGKEAVKF